MKTLTPPNIKFDKIPRDYATTALETCFYQSLGALFNEGEAFFSRSVQAYRKDLPHITYLINEFSKQEMNHSRLHRQLSGIDGNMPKMIEKAIAKPLRLASKHLPRSVNLQITVILEHLTASLADVLLHDRELQDRLLGQAKDLWLYHAREEVEHQEVAITVAIESGCSIALRQALTPIVYVILLTAISTGFLLVAAERKSLRGAVGLSKIIKAMLWEVDWVAPMLRSWHPSC
jgi:predicted metal-dependent hydrolase